MAAVPPFPAHQERTTDTVGGLFRRIESLCDENEMLSGELLRSYDQLNLVFEITDQISTFEDPRQVELSLVRRWGSMLGVTELFLHDGRRCSKLRVAEPCGSLLKLRAVDLRRILKPDIAECRAQHRTMVPYVAPDRRTGLGHAHVLLGTLYRSDATPRVAIALRHPELNAFDARDVLASEAVLGYGGHVLSNLLMMRKLQRTGFETVRALANAIDAKDRYTCGHSERVGFLARAVGEELQLDVHVLQNLEWGGILHDVGKIGIPEAILNKKGRLTAEEFDTMKQHPVLSYEVLKPVDSLRNVLPGVLHHHENHDGSGYPAQLAGDDIPLEARIIHIVDIFDALTSTRSYREGFGVAEAIKILTDGSGTTSDPEINRTFIDLIERFMRDDPVAFADRFPHLAREVGRSPGVTPAAPFSSLDSQTSSRE